MQKNAKLEFSSTIRRLPHLLGMHCMDVPKSIVTKLGGKFRIRLICTVNETVSYHCGLGALGEGKGYIIINNTRLKKLNLAEGDKVKLFVEKDESEFGMEVPEELVEVFAQDSEGFERFSQLTPGRQRNIIHYVSSVKSQQLRVDRAIKLIENLKKLKLGNEDFGAILGKR